MQHSGKAWNEVIVVITVEPMDPGDKTYIIAKTFGHEDGLIVADRFTTLNVRDLSDGTC